MAKKGGYTSSGTSKSTKGGPHVKSGSGVGHSSVPRCGNPPGGKSSATRYDKGTDYHSVDRK